MPMRMKTFWIGIVWIAIQWPAAAQTTLSPGFDPHEYLNLLSITHEQQRGLFPDSGQVRPDSTGRMPVIPPPQGFQQVYRSAEVGLYNQWDLWLNTDSSVAVIAIRGTIMKTESWLENFYAAMVPATGSLRLNDSTRFTYQLATSPRASVHTGWLMGLAYMAPSLLKQIRTYAAKGVSQFIIFGHSQGGAIAFLLRSYLEYLSKDSLPAGLVFKTYCSAAPKPGNLYYAYDFDHITQGGWAYRVVNMEDWVPETPFSLQTLNDFNAVNPFHDIKPALKGTKLLIRLYANHIFRGLKKSSQRANKKFRRTLGRQVYRQIRQALPGFSEPAYAPSMNYMPAGIPIVLAPYPGYEDMFPFNGKNTFVHHGLRPYYELVRHQYHMP